MIAAGGNSGLLVPPSLQCTYSINGYIGGNYQTIHLNNPFRVHGPVPAAYVSAIRTELRGSGGPLQMQVRFHE